MDTDVALLIANIEPVCVSEKYCYYYVPTSSSIKNDKAYMDINKIMSGSLASPFSSIRYKMVSRS